MRSILILATLATSSAMLLAQAAPIKMGLWEKKMVTSNGTGSPTTMTANSCINPAAWQEMVAQLSKQHEGCTMNNVKKAHGYSFTGSCTLPYGTTMDINGSLTIQDDQHIVSESHSTTTANGNKRPIDSHSTSTFLSADCGHIKPVILRLSPDGSWAIFICLGFRECRS
jgi:Protein of unknown function (DUF3617)